MSQASCLHETYGATRGHKEDERCARMERISGAWSFVFVCLLCAILFVKKKLIFDWLILEGFESLQNGNKSRGLTSENEGLRCPERFTTLMTVSHNLTDNMFYV